MMTSEVRRVKVFVFTIAAELLLSKLSTRMNHLCVHASNDDCSCIPC